MTFHSLCQILLRNRIRNHAYFIGPAASGPVGAHRTIETHRPRLEASLWLAATLLSAAELVEDSRLEVIVLEVLRKGGGQTAKVDSLRLRDPAWILKGGP